MNELNCFMMSFEVCKITIEEGKKGIMYHENCIHFLNGQKGRKEGRKEGYC